MMQYTVGFAFYRDQVLLIHKNRGPEAVRGRLNGVGGKVEPGETPVACQRREFREEAGLDIPEDRWTHTVTISHTDRTWEVVFFRTDLTRDERDTYRSMTDEMVMPYDLRELRDLNTVSNLPWLIPLSLDPCVVFPVHIRDRVA